MELNGLKGSQILDSLELQKILVSCRVNVRRTPRNFTILEILDENLMYINYLTDINTGKRGIYITDGKYKQLITERMELDVVFPDNDLTTLFTAKEAAILWGITEEEVYEKCYFGFLQQGFDYRCINGDFLISKTALLENLGTLKSNKLHTSKSNHTVSFEEIEKDLEQFQNIE